MTHDMMDNFFLRLQDIGSTNAGAMEAPKLYFEEQTFITVSPSQDNITNK